MGKKLEHDKEHWDITLLNSLLGKGLTEKAICIQNPEGSKGMSHVEIWGRVFQDRRNSQCKGPETGTCLLCWSNRQEASVAGAE